MAVYGAGCHPQNIIWTEAKLRSIYYFVGERPVHKLPFGPKCHELFAILYSIHATNLWSQEALYIYIYYTSPFLFSLFVFVSAAGQYFGILTRPDQYVFFRILFELVFCLRYTITKTCRLTDLHVLSII
jgi:hypothetical protein